MIALKKIIVKLAEKLTNGEISLIEASRILKEDVLTTFDLLSRHGAKISGKYSATELERQLKRFGK